MQRLTGVNTEVAGANQYKVALIIASVRTRLNLKAMRPLLSTGIRAIAAAWCLFAFASGLAQAQTATGSVEAGKTKVAMCIGCHGLPDYKASFPEVYRVPMIAGQNAKYIVSALTAYSKGERKHPTMRSIAGSMSEQDMLDVAAFYEVQGGKAVSVSADLAAAPDNIKPLLVKGACVSCHGPNLSTPIDGTYPKLAGQHGDYLYNSLKSYKTEGNALVGRSNGVMVAQVKNFSLKELKLLSAYIGSLPTEMKSVPDPFFHHASR